MWHQRFNCTNSEDRCFSWSAKLHARIVMMLYWRLFNNFEWHIMAHFYAQNNVWNSQCINDKPCFHGATWNLLNHWRMCSAKSVCPVNVKQFGCSQVHIRKIGLILISFHVVLRRSNNHPFLQCHWCSSCQRSLQKTSLYYRPLISRRRYSFPNFCPSTAGHHRAHEEQWFLCLHPQKSSKTKPFGFK